MDTEAYTQPVADHLGLAEVQATPLWIADRIEAGLPLTSLDRLVGLLSPEDDTLRYAFVPRATLARRVRSGVLSPEESARLARVAAVWALALEVWKDADDARAFLTRPHMMLGGRRALDVAIATDLGARRVESVLNGLRYGFPA